MVSEHLDIVIAIRRRLRHVSSICTNLQLRIMSSNSNSNNQLPADLQDRLLHSIKTNRPLIYHLTPDSSWLLSLPLPFASTSQPSRSRYNIVIDPWLSGAQIDYYSWFSLQIHASPAAIPSISALEQLLKEVEKLSSEAQSKDSQSNSKSNNDTSLIDAVIISHEFTGKQHQQ